VSYTVTGSKILQEISKRGNSLDKLIPIFKQAAVHLDNKPSATNNCKGLQNTLYIHWRHHPSGLQNKDIQQIFNKNLRDSISFENMQIALSRQKNLRDVLTRAALTLPEDLRIQDLIDQARSST
jgi:hypothetical protein